MTLQRRVSRRTSMSPEKTGPSSYVTDGDIEGIQATIEFQARRGLCLTDGQFRRLIRETTQNHSAVPPTFPNRKCVQRCI